jgi:hypothetical protein
MIPVVYRGQGAIANANYAYEDVANGLGYVLFYPSSTASDTWRDYILNSTALLAADTDGLITTKSQYHFETSGFNLPRQIKGDAYLTGYAHDAGIIGTAKVSVVSGTAVAGGTGAVIQTSAAEVNTNEVFFTLKKTITINDYCDKVTSQAYVGAGGTGCYIQYNWNYAGESNVAASNVSTASFVYVTLTSDNPNKTKFVTKLEVYMKQTGGSLVYEKDTNVYAETITGLTVTDISSTITTPTFAAPSPFNILIPLTQTRIKAGERIRLTFTNAGGAGAFVLDPTNEVVTHASLKLYLPFRIDL